MAAIEDPMKFLELAWQEILGLDTETNAKDIRSGEGFAMGISLAFESKAGFYLSHYFPFRHKFGENYDAGMLANVKLLIESAPRIVMHNAKFDLESIRTLGINYDNGDWYCTMVMASQVDENRPVAKGLDFVGKYYCGEGKEKSEELDLIIKGFGWYHVPVEMMRKYAEQDAVLPLKIIKVLWPKYQTETREDMWQWKRRFINTVRMMERRGVLIDQDYCRSKAEEAEQARDDYHEMLGGYNPGSFKDMNLLLCETLGLPPIMRERYDKKTKTKKYTQTFDKGAMEEYEEMLETLDSPIAEYVLAHRGWTKAASAFYNAYLTHVSPDGRVRPTYHHHKSEGEGGTVTGRLSCSNPNLQQIPKESKKPWNGGVKKAFVAREGYELWEVDYSQLELRLGTGYAKVQSLIDTFNEGRDIFDEMAITLGYERQIVKTFVYMTQYGAGPAKIARVLKIDQAEAERLRDEYYATYPGFRKINTAVETTIKRNKKIKLWSGRYRHFLNPKDEARKGLNSMIQGGSADIVERSMVRVFEDVDQKSDDECRMLLTVHDSVWFEIKIGTESKYLSQICEIMEDVEALGDFEGIKFAVEAKNLRTGEKFTH